MSAFSPATTKDADRVTCMVGDWRHSELKLRSVTLHPWVTDRHLWDELEFQNKGWVGQWDCR